MSTQYPASLKAVGGARTGVAPVNLLDVQDVNGNMYYWADRAIIAPYANGGNLLPYSLLGPPVPTPAGQRVAWAFPTAVSTQQGSHTTVSATLLEGKLVCTWSGITETQGSVTWSNFAMPLLPPGAVLESAYLSAWAAQGGSGASIGWPLSPYPVADTAGQFSIETVATPAAIAAATMTCWLYGSVPIGQILETLIINGPAIAIYYSVPAVVTGGYDTSDAPVGLGPYDPWILSAPQLTFHRSLQTDVGNFVLQNLSGDTLSRDFEKIMRRSALEGAFYVYRLWQPGAEAAWIEVHGTLTVDDVGVDTVSLKGLQSINPAQDDTPLEVSCETCQLTWGLARCGATGATECQYSYQTCQVIERIMVVLNDFEKNYGETTANTAMDVINRRRKF